MPPKSPSAALADHACGHSARLTRCHFPFPRLPPAGSPTRMNILAANRINSDILGRDFSSLQLVVFLVALPLCMGICDRLGRRRPHWP